MFIREHLSPRYSHIAKPLRDVLAQLQADRKAGLKKGRARFTPTGPAAPDHKWAAFWNQECEEAFEALKRLTTQAVELQVPDMKGAADGSNPYHLWLDACAYGIGAGLFQGPSTTEKPTGVAQTHYEVLRLPTWSTKLEIGRRYQDLKRRGALSRNPECIEAYECLSQDDTRRAYDESIGLAEKRRSRLDLRPLGFYSKSLSREQRNWTTWE